MYVDLISSLLPIRDLKTYFYLWFFLSRSVLLHPKFGFIQFRCQLFFSKLYCLVSFILLVL